VKQYPQLINIEISKLNLWIRASPDFKFMRKRKDGFFGYRCWINQNCRKLWVVQAHQAAWYLKTGSVILVITKNGLFIKNNLRDGSWTHHNVYLNSIDSSEVKW